MTSDELLRAEEVSKSFPGVRALKAVSLEIRTAEIVSLIGENGSGKSTLLTILAGVQEADSARIYWEGQPVRYRSGAEALGYGIALVTQDLALAPHLSIAENVLLGRRKPPFFVHGRREARAARQVLAEHLDLELDVTRLVRTLKPNEAVFVAIARAFAQEPRVLLLDEPTAPLGAEDASHLLEAVRRLTEHGTAVAFTSHRLKEHRALAGRAVVLRDGQLMANVPIASVRDEKLIRLMVGRDLPELLGGGPAPGERETGSHRLELKAVRLAPAAEPISTHVRAGEILGVAGLAGSGRTRLARVVAGAAQPESGSIVVNGQARSFTSPADALSVGIGLLPEDRKTQALLLPLTIRENISVSILHRISRFGVIRRKAERQNARRQSERLGIRARSIESRVRTLSGGNQQKVVVARLLSAAVDVLVLDEPTKGIDVAAKAEMFQLIRQAAGDGKAVVFISSELPELLALSDRIAVMREGSVAAEIPSRLATEERIVAAAVGAG